MWQSVCSLHCLLLLQHVKQVGASSCLMGKIQYYVFKGIIIYCFPAFRQQTQLYDNCTNDDSKTLWQIQKLDFNRNIFPLKQPRFAVAQVDQHLVILNYPKQTNWIYFCCSLVNVFVYSIRDETFRESVYYYFSFLYKTKKGQNTVKKTATSQQAKVQAHHENTNIWKTSVLYFFVFSSCVQEIGLELSLNPHSKWTLNFFRNYCLQTMYLWTSTYMWHNIQLVVDQNCIARCNGFQLCETT